MAFWQERRQYFRQQQPLVRRLAVRVQGILTLFGILFISLLCAGACSAAFGMGEGGYFGISTIFAVFLFTGITWFMSWATKQWNLDEDQLDHEVLLSDRSVALRMGGLQAIFDWSVLKALTISGTHIFFVHNANGGVVVPKRAFASPQEAAAFAQFAQERFATSRVAP